MQFVIVDQLEFAVAGDYAFDAAIAINDKLKQTARDFYRIVFLIGSIVRWTRIVSHQI